MPTVMKQQLNEIVVTLAERFPDTFSVFHNRRKPLKIGIRRDLSELLGATIDQKMLSAALRFYTSNPGYLRAQRVGADRIDLDGHAVGTVSADEAATAQQRLAAVAAK